MMDFKSIIKFSDLLLNDKISFVNKWDMESCQKIYKIKKFNKTPNKDPEWVYMLNRFEYLNKLIISYQVTKDIKYIEKYYEIVDRWNKKIYKYIINKDIYHSKIGVLVSFYRKLIRKICSLINISYIFINPVRTLDTAIRCFSLTNDTIYLKKNRLLSNEYDLKENIIKQLEYVKKIHHISHDYDNWGLLECIYSLYCLIEFESTNTNLYKWNNKKYLELLNRQILSDGTQIENTPLYHVQIFIALSHLLNIKKNHNMIIDDNELSVIKKMADYIYEISDLQNNIINYGDSDSTNISELMYVAYLILEDKKYLLKINNKLDVYFLSRFTYDIYFDYDNKNVYKNTKENILFKDSKNALFKDNNNYLFVSNNDNITSHRHIDLGSFIYCHNVPFLIDSGRYTYNYNKYRKYLKSQFAHNTLYMNNNKLGIIKSSWISKKNTCESIIKIHSDNIIYLCIKDKKNVYERFFVLLNEGLIIVNIINSSDNKKHNSNRNYILDDKVKVEKSNIYKLINRNNRLYVYTNSDNVLLRKTYISKKYNSIVNTNKFVFSNRFTKKSVSYDLFLNKQCNVSFNDNSCTINNKNITIKDNNIIIK